MCTGACPSVAFECPHLHVLLYMQVCSRPNLGAIVKSTCVSLVISNLCKGLFCLSGHGCVSENAPICISLCFQLCGARI